MTVSGVHFLGATYWACAHSGTSQQHAAICAAWDRCNVSRLAASGRRCRAALGGCGTAEGAHEHGQTCVSEQVQARRRSAASHARFFLARLQLALLAAL